MNSKESEIRTEADDHLEKVQRKIDKELRTYQDKTAEQRIEAELELINHIMDYEIKMRKLDKERG